MIGVLADPSLRQPESALRIPGGGYGGEVLVEDNRDLAFGLQRNLEFEGYAVEVAEDGPTGLARSPKITSS